MESEIYEHIYYEEQSECEALGIHSEARGVFSCSKVPGSGPPTAVIKIRQQSVSSNQLEEKHMLTFDGQDSVVENRDEDARNS